MKSAVINVPNSGAELLPSLQAELRQLAAQRLAHECTGQTLQATALVHVAWLAVKRKLYPEGTVGLLAILLALLLSTSLATAQSPSNLAAKTPETIRIVVLPFLNASGDTNRADWQQALPALIRGNLQAAGSWSVVGGKKIREALKANGRASGSKVDAELARQVARGLNARVVVWGRFQRQTNHWIVAMQMLDANAPAEPTQLNVASPDWNGLPQLAAIAVAKKLGRPIPEDDLQHVRKYLAGSENAPELLAQAVALDFREAPAEERERTLHRLLAAAPHCGMAHMDLAQLYAEAGRTNELQQAISEFLRQCPDLCDAHLLNTWLLTVERDPAGIHRELNEALRLHRGCPGACQQLFGIMGGVEQRWEDLRPILEAAHTARPENSDTLILLAGTRALCGDLEGTRELLNAVVDLPETNLCLDLALLNASLFAMEYDLAGRELARLGPQAADDEVVRENLEAVKFYRNKDITNDSNASIVRPRSFIPAELDVELVRRLTDRERELVVNPLAITPEIAAEARRLTLGLPNDTLRTIALFAEVARRGRGEGDGGTRTASQTLAQASDPQARFSCQEYAKLFVALARSAGLESWLVHIERDADGNPGYHDCAVIFVDGVGILVDPAWRVIGIRHEAFTVLDDAQAISHQAMQLHGQPVADQLRMGLKLNPDDRWTQLQFVRGMASLGDFSAATGELAKVRKTGVETWDVHEAAAELEIKRLSWQPALAELQCALALSPSNTTVHFHLAQVYGALGDPVKATGHMDAALRFERGEMSKADRRETSAQVSAMKTVIRSTAGDSSARVEMQRMAGAGDVIAQTGMANACFNEKPPRLEEGMRWLRQAAGQGNAQSQYDCAKILDLIHGDATGPEQMMWLARAAEQGHAEAQYRLGRFLYEGKLAPRDNIAAGQWIVLATRNGHAEAKYLLQEMELFLSGGELAEARKRAAGFKVANTPAILEAK